MEDDLRPRLSLSAPEEERRRALRGFGIGLGVIICFFAWRTWRHHDAAPAWSAAALLSWLLAAAYPKAFGPIYDVWMPAVGVLAKVNLWLICGILYYLIMTPYAVILRAFGVKPLAFRLREKDSYWEDKPPRDPAESARSPF